MRFSLQDVKKSVQRRGGTLAVSLHFLRANELQDEITRLIAYYERLLAQPQRAFSMDEARTFIGDYRMAHCLMATVSHWYSWRQREWQDAVQELGGNADLLALTSAVQLRLTLYNYVNEHYHGFLLASQREEALQIFAQQYAVSAAHLDYLLGLDSEDEAILTRDAPVPPEHFEVATLYNQWTFEAALFNSSHVHFVVDCMAFSRLESPQETSGTPIAGVGAVIKRLCYLARRMGVYYDLEYEGTSSVSTSRAGLPTFLNLTLYGPQEVTGAPQQYGLRLARLCRILLGYGVKSPTKKAHPQLSVSIIEAEARVHFLQRAYIFAMDAKVLQLLPFAPEATGKGTVINDVSQLFDSSIEQNFSEGFVSLARNQGVDGWQLEREPEPLLLDKGIFIPDFALTRGMRRIYVEILGFWTPAYRERKVQKLQYLRGREDLVLIIPIEAKEAFASIAADFPIVYYREQISIMDVLQVLRSHYEDFEARLALIEVLVIRQQVQQQGFIAERDCYRLLHSYRRSELQQAAALVCVDTPAIVFVPGLGFYHTDWLLRLKQMFLTWLSIVHSAVWDEALRILRDQCVDLRRCEDATLETLLGLWSEVRIQRDSIFDVTVELAIEQPVQEHIPEDVDHETRKPVRERRVTAKKRAAPPPEAVQGDLWG